MKFIENPKKLTLKQMSSVYGGKTVNCGKLMYCHVFNEVCDPFGGSCGQYSGDIGGSCIAFSR